jgi:hypothetical protein
LNFFGADSGSTLGLTSRFLLLHPLRQLVLVARAGRQAMPATSSAR